MKQILHQEYTVSSPFDEKMCLNAIQSQLSSIIFKELIKEEKGPLVITFTIKLKEQQ